MATIITDKNVVIDRDYTDNFSVKETALTNLGYKYFGDVELSGLNVGALGFTLEQISNITEDAFNTASVMVNELFPNRAIIPDSIYSHAAIFQMDNIFANCASCSFVMLLEQKEVLKYAKKENNIFHFYIDKKTVINVENIPFTLDYDIEIKAEAHTVNALTEYNFSAAYCLSENETNSISNVYNPYLKIRKTKNGLLILQFTAHQVERTELHDNIISNTKINYPILEFEFNGTLAGFDIYYKPPSSNEYTQLNKRIFYSIPLATPFCYYRLKDENTLLITFTSRDGYFKPDFNSDIKLILYTTLGERGCFDVYEGNNITVETNTETYEYNDMITIATKPVSSSQGGTSALSLESLQQLTVEAYSSATEISTEYDIMKYFYDYKYRYGNEMLVIKRRDDITERLFSAFLLIKNGDHIYPTNTLNLKLLENDDFGNYDSHDNNKNIFTLKPGHLFTYNGDSTDVKIIDGNSWNEEDVNDAMNNNAFVFTNPFLISVTKDANIVGIYQTVTQQTVPLDFIDANTSSFTEFITSKINLERGLEESAEYKLSLSIVPSSSIDEYVTNVGDDTYNENNKVRIFASFVNSNNHEVGYIELLPSYINESDKSNVTFSRMIKSNDTITSKGEFTIQNATPFEDFADVSIPITDVTVNIYIFFKDENATEQNMFEISGFTMTNHYKTNDEQLDFIKPMNMMRSTITFNNIGSDVEPNIQHTLSLLPMIRADVLNNIDDFNIFVNRFTACYEYMKECLPLLRNNTHLDIKFYNTYGKSNNYIIGDNNELIDRVDMSISFKIVIQNGTDPIEIRTKLKLFIKEFIEKVNSEGTNDLYISNLIRQIETNFAEVHHLKFTGINNYNTEYHTIRVKEKDFTKLTKEERRNYVPEILVADVDKINLSITSN